MSTQPTDAKVQYDLGVRFHYAHPQDFKNAFKWYTKAAEQGYSKAQRALGEMYDKGEGVTQDFKEAFKWYAKAAEQGNPRAQYLLGNMYLEGKGVNQDFGKAIEWFDKSEDQGFILDENSNK